MRIVLLHGFTQTHFHWYRPAAALAAVDPTVAFTFVDLPGHGGASMPRDFKADAAELAKLAGPGTYVGYSMGGRLALAAALARPDIVERLVLIGATAGIDDPVMAAERRATDEERASSIERDGVAAFLNDWLAMPMFAGLPDAGLSHRLHNTATGLAASLRRHGTGSQPSYWDRLGELAMPLLYLAGERDDKFIDVGRRMVEAAPNAELVIAEGAGHACHLERPEPVAAEITTWLDRTTNLDRPAPGTPRARR